jgi:hypothetical protein
MGFTSTGFGKKVERLGCARYDVGVVTPLWVNSGLCFLFVFAGVSVGAVAAWDFGFVAGWNRYGKGMKNCG